MKLAIYRRGSHASSIYFTLSDAETDYLFGKTIPNRVKTTTLADGRTIILTASASDDEGTKVNSNSYSYYFSRSVPTLGVKDLKDSVAVTDVVAEPQIENGQPTIAITIPEMFLRTEHDVRIRRHKPKRGTKAASEPAQPEQPLIESRPKQRAPKPVAENPITAPAPTLTNEDRLRDLMSMVNDAVDGMEVRLVVEDGRLAAYRKVEIKL